MDPTKNFDHLDPKLKDTYARVMGTTAPGGDAQTPTAQPTAADPNVTTPPVADPSQSVMNPIQNQFNPAPLDQPLSPIQNQNTDPNPGTGPTINSIPTDTTTMISPPLTEAAPDTNAPTTSSFFSNPSPATTDPTQGPIPMGGPTNNLSAPLSPVTEPASAPVTPYSPDTQSQYLPPAEQTTQPLPSPSSVAQAAPHQASALLRVLYIIGAVVFFAIYTVFWIKVFNLPFLF